MKQGETLTIGNGRTQYVKKNNEYIRETAEETKERVCKKLGVAVMVVVESDIVSAERAGRMVVEPWSNTMKVKTVVASRQGPYLPSIRDLAQTHCTTISFTLLPSITIISAIATDFQNK